MDEHDAWRERVAEAGLQATPVIDRFYFRSVYFREPGGILYEIATLGPGFTTDEPLEHAGRAPGAAAGLRAPARAGRAAADAAARRAPVAAGASRLSAPPRARTMTGSAAPTSASAPRGPASATIAGGEHRARAPVVSQ